jgi:alginate O-acetyltransferase complex protein AlgI
MSAERLAGTTARPPRSIVWRFVRRAITLHLVCLSWVVFRAGNMERALLVLRRIFSFAPGDLTIGPLPVLYLACVVVGGLAGIKQRWLEALASRPVLARWVAYASAAAFALVFAGASNPEFIYFQF